MLAYDGANLWPMAVPWICRYSFPSNVKLLVVKQMCRSCRRWVSGLSGSGLLLKVVLIESVPRVWSMFVYKLSISIVKRCV